VIGLEEYLTLSERREATARRASVRRSLCGAVTSRLGEWVRRSSRMFDRHGRVAVAEFSDDAPDAHMMFPFLLVGR
jgi:hypothetical protein